MICTLCKCWVPYCSDDEEYSVICYNCAITVYALPSMNGFRMSPDDQMIGCIEYYKSSPLANAIKLLEMGHCPQCGELHE
jgi:hypothetical protein